MVVVHVGHKLEGDAVDDVHIWRAFVYKEKGEYILVVFSLYGFLVGMSGGLMNNRTYFLSDETGEGQVQMQWMKKREKGEKEIDRVAGGLWCKIATGFQDNNHEEYLDS